MKNVLTLSKRQLVLVGEAGFHERMMEHAKRAFPDVAARLGQRGLFAHLLAAVDRASEYALTYERDVRRFCDLTFVYGLDWSGADRRWLHDHLTDRDVTSPSARMERLWRRALRAEAQAR